MRLLIYILLGYLIYRLYRFIGSFFVVYRDRNITMDNDNTVDEMVQDPYCKTYIPLTGAYKRTINGKTYFFCSKECADNFSKTRRDS